MKWNIAVTEQNFNPELKIDVDFNLYPEYNRFFPYLLSVSDHIIFL